MKHLLLGGLFVFSTSLLLGCSLFNDLLTQDALAEYGESVFRKQNLITSKIMLLSESELSIENTQKLQQAESQMQQACRLLNEYATKEMDKANIDLLFRKQVKDSIKGCDLSIQQMGILLSQLGIEE
jgi:hypothetical protein